MNITQHQSNARIQMRVRSINFTNPKILGTALNGTQFTHIRNAENTENKTSNKYRSIIHCIGNFILTKGTMHNMPTIIA